MLPPGQDIKRLQLISHKAHRLQSNRSVRVPFLFRGRKNSDSVHACLGADDTISHPDSFIWMASLGWKYSMKIIIEYAFQKNFSHLDAHFQLGPSLNIALCELLYNVWMYHSSSRAAVECLEASDAQEKWDWFGCANHWAELRRKLSNFSVECYCTAGCCIKLQPIPVQKMYLIRPLLFFAMLPIIYVWNGTCSVQPG